VCTATVSAFLRYEIFSSRFCLVCKIEEVKQQKGRARRSLAMTRGGDAYRATASVCPSGQFAWLKPLTAACHLEFLICRSADEKVFFWGVVAFFGALAHTWQIPKICEPQISGPDRASKGRDFGWRAAASGLNSVLCMSASVCVCLCLFAVF